MSRDGMRAVVCRVKPEYCSERKTQHHEVAIAFIILRRLHHYKKKKHNETKVNGFEVSLVQ